MLFYKVIQKRYKTGFIVEVDRMISFNAGEQADNRNIRHQAQEFLLHLHVSSRTDNALKNVDDVYTPLCRELEDGVELEIEFLIRISAVRGTDIVTRKYKKIRIQRSRSLLSASGGLI